MINPYLKERLAKETAKWTASHRVGIDDGKTFIVRGGARDNSDLISVGHAPNIAAKLSGVRGEGGQIIVTSNVYGYLFPSNLKSNDAAMWVGPTSRTVGPHVINTYNCGWMRKP